jgi:hypothetical protein
MAQTFEPFDDSYMNHDLMDWTLMLMTISFGLTFYDKIFFTIAFIFISKNKEHNEMINKRNSDLIKALFGAKNLILRQSSKSVKRIGGRVEHECKFCNESPLSSRKLISLLIIDLKEIIGLIYGVIALLVNYSEIWFYILSFVTFIVMLCSILDSRTICSRLRKKSCGFETVEVEVS